MPRVNKYISYSTGSQSGTSILSTSCRRGLQRWVIAFLVLAVTEEKRLLSLDYTLFTLTLLPFFPSFFFFFFFFFWRKGVVWVSLAGAATSIIFVATNMCLSRQKKCLLSRQKYACRDKTFVTTKLCLSPQYLSRQIFLGYFSYFLAKKDVYACQEKYCHEKNILSRQKMILVAFPANGTCVHSMYQLLSIDPILRTCSDFTETKERCFPARSLKILFEDISLDYIFEYLKEINIFGRLQFCDPFSDLF